jgi:GDP-L-fucose synthase
MKMAFWTNKRVVVTGGAGFLGSFVIEKLRERGCTEIVCPRSKDYDLREKDQVDRLFRDARPEIVFHLAAVVGGIGANRRHPGRFFYENAIMGIHTIECARLHGIGTFVCIGTVCSYPKFTSVPFKEDDFWNGYPEETNAPYGLAKKMLLAQLQAYRQEYGFNGIYLTPVNLYGPRDNFDLENSHVVPALIRKLVEAKRANVPTVNAWGTGQATREFLYVEDAAEGIVVAAEKYYKPDLVNLGANEEISIRDLAQLLQGLVGYAGTIEWDSSRPDGQPRRRLDTSRALEEFGWQARTPIKVGLRNTINWYEQESEATVRAGGHL